ncbi:esterase-like activity of phytase family protein [Niveispirillum sp. BGYR6]|uniref:esterase-like activity of phytase family protein n=1 Tax=Niveispirillum sp. BGYR6 TaxID=2971249 RepID=UPI0022B9C009|nr:esterase-like activity of phytase family protein [Niveispirillum sp. BGYR6]MDG5494888.1 esterase-like activity of phytase family protein [Niveispirillum sp. BGYR6]
MKISIRSALLASALSFVTLPAFAQSASTVTLNGTSFTNQGLQGVGRLSAALRDKYGETFGSISAMQIDLHSWQRNADGSYSGTLYTLPDRGYNVASTTNYIPRYNVLSLSFNPYSGTASLPAATAQQNQIGLTLKDTVQFTDDKGTPFSGLDPASTGSGLTYRPAANGMPNLPLTGTGRLALDPEGFVRVSDGSIWVSDEYGPYIYHFTGDGKLISAIAPPNSLLPLRNGAPNFGAAESTPVNPSRGRQNNQGLEGLSMSPDGKTLWVALQSAAVQDLDINSTNSTRRNTRLLAYDVSNSTSPVLKGEYVIQLPMYNNNGNPNGALNRVAAQSELLALNNTQFLLLSRDGNGYGSGATPNSSPTSFYRRIDLLDITGASNIAGTAYDNGTSIAPKGVLVADIKPVQFASFVDINDATQLAKFGLVNGATNNVNCRTQCLSEKWEALALVPALDAARLDDFFLFVGNDNDFVTQNGSQVGQSYKDASGVENDTTLLAYRLTLPTYVDPLASESQALTGPAIGQALGETALAANDAATSDLTGRTQAIRAGLAKRAEGSFELSAGGNWSVFARDDGDAKRLSKPESWSSGIAGDYAVSDTLRVGLAVNYAHSDGKFGNLGGGKATVWAVGPYASLALPGGFYADASYHYSDLSLDDISRNTFAYNLRATGETEGKGHHVGVEFGSVETAGSLRYGPIVSFNYNRVELDAWKEAGALHLNLDHPKLAEQQLLFNVGGQISTSLDMGGGRMVVPELRVSYQEDLIRDEGQTYTTVLSNRRNSPLGRNTAILPDPQNNGLRVGVGLSVAVADKAALYVSGNTLFNVDDKPDYSLGAGLRVGF